MQSLDFIISLLLMIKRSTALRSYFSKERNCTCSSKYLIFRLDDIRDYCFSAAQIAVLDIFISKHQNISLGLMMKFVGNDQPLMQKIRQGNIKNLFELCLHGWDHEDYSKLNQIEQENLFCTCNNSMMNLFGNVSKIFIPPYNKFNNYTLSAMKKQGIEIISAAIYTDKYELFDLYKGSQNAIHSVDHVPETTTFEIFRGDKPYRVPIKRIIGDVNKSIMKYGYAVITIHPMSFVKSEWGNLSQSLDEKKLNDLSILIDNLISQNIRLTTFSKITGAKLDTQTKNILF